MLTPRTLTLRCIATTLLPIGLLIGSLAATTSAGAIETKAKQVILIDDSTGTVLLEKNADELMAPSSMSKIMTIYMVLESLKAGTLSLDDTFEVSEKAWRKGGSKMFVEVGKRVRIDDLLRGIIVQSGNDACIVIAEGISGDEKTFAAEMTERGREIGLENSTFRNSSGWPQEGHVMTARDLAILAKRTIDEFPEYYPIFAEKKFTFNGIEQNNRNPLLYKDVDADGLKTGHTDSGGYGLTASAIRDGRRLILVINGLKSTKARSSESERLIEYGFREFRNYTLLAAGATVAEAEVWLGDTETVPLVVAGDLTVTLPVKARKKMEAKVVYQGPLSAPIARGTQVATLVLSAPDMPAIEVPLQTGADVGEISIIGRMGVALAHLIFGALPE